MTNILKRYQDSVRELDQAEAGFRYGNIDAHTLQRARDEARAARAAWEAERDKLTKTQHLKLAQQAAVEDVQNGQHNREEDALMHTKALIKTVRKELAEARAENKRLYAELQENRARKKELNDEYARLRAQRKQLEEVRT